MGRDPDRVDLDHGDPRDELQERARARLGAGLPPRRGHHGHDRDADVRLLPPEALALMPIHHEIHRYDRIGWLRAAVLGSGDGIVSTASIMIGVAASNASRSSIIIAGLSAPAAGATAMGTGEYNPVSSHRDHQQADNVLDQP